MGVAGLWEVLRSAGQVRSLTELAVEDGFNANPSHQRGFRIGIDASIWFFHAAYGREGENPELRTLFFRCCRLLHSPLLPLFVFDGPHRPAIKRGKRVGGNAHWLIQGTKNMIDAFGFEWRIAPGEAEAELAYLNRSGIIDAVLSDDSDNFLFGATMVIRNPSNTLSGNRAHPVKNAQGKDDGNHVVTYTSHAILSEPSVALSRAGTILIGLLSGGDYIPAGVPGCGQKFATGLARAGFGDSLVKAAKELKGSRLDTFLDQWRQDVRNELKTNKSGLLPSKKPSLAASLPDDFPSLPVLMSYADPLTSENAPQKGKRKTPPCVWRNDPDPTRIASLCELYFEWGVKDIIVHRFRTVLWPGMVCRAVRRVVVDEDARQRSPLDARDSDREGGNHAARHSSPTKQICATLSTLVLSSPSKKSTPPDISTSQTSPSESFTLSSLVSLTSLTSASSSRLAPSALGSPPLLLEVLSQRAHVSTDSTLEYRVLVDPTALVERAESGVKGLRPPLVGGLFGIDPEDESEDQDADESGSDGGTDGIERLETAATAASKSGTKKRKARREVPTAPLRLWLPACMIRAAAPALAEAYEEKVSAREEKKAKRGTRGRRGGRAENGAKSTKRKTKGKDVVDDGGDESLPGPSIPKATAGSKTKAKGVAIGGGRRRKPKQASEAQNDAYEYIDLSAGESPCSSDEEGVEENAKGKGKGKAKPKAKKIIATKPITKTSAKTNAAGAVATTNTMNEFFNSTKPSTAQVTKSKQSTSRLSVVKGLSLDHTTLNPIHPEEEEDSVDVLPPSLPRSSRPLDLLHAKPKASGPPNQVSKSRSSIPRYEEGESSPSSPLRHPSRTKPNALSLPRAAQLVLQRKKKPLFVDVSDTDSDVEVVDIRRPLHRTTVATTGRNNVGDVVSLAPSLRLYLTPYEQGVSVDAGKKLLSAFESQETPERIVDGAIDLTARENPNRSKSVCSILVPTTSLPCELPDAFCAMPISRSPSKLAHILLPPLGSESEEQEHGSEGDELPTFHRGSAKSRAKKMVARPMPQPFPMQPVSQPPGSPRISRLGELVRSCDDDGPDVDDIVEIVDMFTTPHGSSPPRTPTPSPSPLKLHAPAGPATYVKSRQSKALPGSPIRSKPQTNAEQRGKTKQRSCVSSDQDTRTPRSERDEIRKSPRKSAVHSSPRHVLHARARAASPTPVRLSHSGLLADNAPKTANARRYSASDNCQPQCEDSGSMHLPEDDVGRKPWSSDTSVVYISSGSEDQGNARRIDNGRGGDAQANEDLDQDTDEDVDGWADRGMILSAPPSPAFVAASHTADPIPATIEDIPPNPVRASKFRPAMATASNVDVRAPSADFLTSAKTRHTGLAMNDEDIPRPARRAPSLVARIKKSKASRGDDIIDLTSD